MTDKVNPSYNRGAKSDEVAQLIARASNAGDGYVVPADTVFLADRDVDLSTAELNGFAEAHSASSFDVTIDGGEAIVNGAWVARDVSTTVQLDASTTGQVVYLGWDTSDTAGAGDTVIIGTSGDFAPDDYKIPIWEFDTDGSGVTASYDHRPLGNRASAGRVHAEYGVTVGQTLPTGEELTVSQDESMVVGESYTIEGDADIQGDLVTVSNRPSHGSLADVDPTDHLEVVYEAQVTASSGTNPGFDGTLTNVFDEELTAWDVTVTPTTGLDESYGYNVDTGRHWNNGSWDLALTVNWDEQPSSDLELTVRIHRRT